MAKIQPIYRNGKKLSNSEIRFTIMKANNITSIRDYEKFYDITRNKLRNYELFTGKKKESVREFLYKEARSKLYYGKDYKMTIERQRINEFTSMSTGKAIQKALKTPKFINNALSKYEQEVYIQFKGLIEKNPMAREIWENVIDIFKRDQALKDFANKLHAELDAIGNATGRMAIPERNDVFGSDIFNDFDYSSYMSE